MASSSSPVRPDSQLERAHTALNAGDAVLARALLSDFAAIERDEVGAFALAPQLSSPSRHVEPTPTAVAAFLRESLSPPRQVFVFAAVCAAVLLAMMALAVLHR